MQMAKEFAEYWGVGVEDWMLWPGWQDWIGCETCGELGPDAPCWGHAGCHGYYRGCGCRNCIDRDMEEAEKDA